MVPGHYGQRAPYTYFKGGKILNNPNHLLGESDSSESVHNTMSEFVTTVKNIINDTITNPSYGNENGANDASDDGANPGIAEMMNNTLPNMGDTMENSAPGISHLLNNTITNIAQTANNNSFVNPTLIGTENDGNQMFNTSPMEMVTTEINDWSTPMMHHGGDDNYDGLIYIILGIVLGVLIITVLVLAVVYNHYRKRDFQDISGSNKDKCDPPSMRNLEQSCSEDTLINK